MVLKDEKRGKDKTRNKTKGEGNKCSCLKESLIKDPSNGTLIIE